MNNLSEEKMDINDLDFLKQKKEIFINMLKENIDKIYIMDLKDLFESNKKNNSEVFFNNIVLFKNKLSIKEWGDITSHENYFCELIDVYEKIIERILFFSKKLIDINNDYIKERIMQYRKKLNSIEECMVKNLWLSDDILFGMIMMQISVCERYGICLCSEEPYDEKCMLV